MIGLPFISTRYTKSCLRRLAPGLLFFVIATSAPTSGVASAQDGSSGVVIHVVAWGETLSSIAARYGVTIEAIQSANNLATADRIFAGQRLVIPGAQGDAVRTQPGQHVVQPGENLYRISLRYGVSMEELAAANSLVNGDQVFVGQSLIIPVPGSVAAIPPQAATTIPPGGVHVVQAGETLFSISRRYGISVSSLTTVNHLVNPSAIYAGQRLVLPGGAAASGSPGYTPATSSTTHTVSAGETLFSIAQRYGTSGWVLAQANNIGNPSLLYSGQVLTIPSADALTQPPTALPGLTGVSKSIVVDISDQRAYVYENGQLIWTFVISSGMPGSETARGNFQIQNKIPNAYASTWDLQMPYWLGFYWSGPLQNGFHALPIMSNGVKLWEGLLGSKASYGCIILSDQDARTLYEWADIGTPVTVRD